MAVISGLRIGKINVWPGDVLDSYDRIGGMSNQQVTEALQTVSVTSDNSTEPMRLVNFFSCLIYNVNNKRFVSFVKELKLIITCALIIQQIYDTFEL